MREGSRFDSEVGHNMAEKELEQLRQVIEEMKQPKIFTVSPELRELAERITKEGKDGPPPDKEAWVEQMVNDILYLDY